MKDDLTGYAALGGTKVTVGIKVYRASEDRWYDLQKDPWWVRLRNWWRSL